MGAIATLLDRLAAWRQEQQRRAELARLKRQIEAEARLYATLIIERWTQLGFCSHFQEDGKRKRRVRKVKFELVRYNEYAIYFKIWVRAKGLFGYVNKLPYGVRVADLISEETLTELEAATQRRVTARRDEPSHGAWIIVHRSDGAGLLPKMVHYKHILPYHETDPDDAPFVLGVGQYNTLHASSLAKHAHILIGGASRSGKSNMLNCILTSFVRFCTPRDLQLILIDPKRVELSHYLDAPHLAREVVYRQDEAIEVLQYANEEIDRRTEMFMQARCKNIKAWNRKFPDKRVPRLVIVVEEVASLYEGDAGKKKVLMLVRRIASMGAAVGVHLIMCTQMPTVEIIPNTVKVNMLLAISGKTMNVDQSRVILGVGAAAKLPDIPGRMIVAREANIYELQTPLIDDDDIAEAIQLALQRERKPKPEPEPIPEWFAAPEPDWFTVPEPTLEHQAEPVPVQETPITWLALPEPKAESADVPHLLLAPEPAPAEPEPVPVVRVEIPDEDFVFRQFLLTCCVIDKRSTSTAAALFSTYRQFCESREYPAVKRVKFGMLMRQAGFKTQRTATGHMAWLGIRLGMALEPDNIPEESEVPEVHEKTENHKASRRAHTPELEVA